MSWGVNLEDVAAARDELLEEAGERADSHTLERLARAHRWLGEEDAARTRFGAAAAAAQLAFERWGREDPGAIGRIGSLLWRARDADAAEPWLARAARTRMGAADAAELSYLRADHRAAAELAAQAVAEERTDRERAAGEEDPGVPRGGADRERATAEEDPGVRRGGADRGPGAAGAPAAAATRSPYPRADAIGALAVARRDGDPGAAADAVARFAALIGAERTAPDAESGSPGLSLFDWLEEAARARADLEGGDPPAHAVLLEQAGLLSAERRPRRPPAPDVGPSRPGSATIAYPAPDGGAVTPSVTVDEAGDIHFVLDPARDLRASLLQHDGMWHARLGDTDLPGSFRGPRGAKRALWEPLYERQDGQWAVALLDELFTESFRV